MRQTLEDFLNGGNELNDDELFQLNDSQLFMYPLSDSSPLPSPSAPDLSFSYVSRKSSALLSNP